MFVCPHLIRYPCPISIGSPWNTGIILGALIYTQLVTGILLGLHYTPGIYTAYHSVARTSREVYYGSVLRLGHSGGCSGVFLGVWPHGGRGAFHGSHVSGSGVLSTGPGVYWVLMVTGFLGYVLPWGLMSYWGATVITSLGTGIPCMVPWLWGGSLPGREPGGLCRYFIVHPVLPLPVPLPLALHPLSVHRSSSSSGTGYGTNNRVLFHTWLSGKDSRGLSLGALVVLVQVYHGTLTVAHPDNSLEASAVFTPLHIVPEWYYLGYYSVLKAAPGRASGFLVMVSCSLGAGVSGEPYGTSPLPGSSHWTGRYTLVLLVSLASLGTLWIGVQLPQGVPVSTSRGFIWVTLPCNIGYTRPGTATPLPGPRLPWDSSLPLEPYHPTGEGRIHGSRFILYYYVQYWYYY